MNWSASLVNQSSSDQPTRRPAGRPRSFDDADVFAATNRALVREGYANLTLAAIARELGITGPALNRRYGDKHTLMEAYIGWLTDQMVVRLADAKAHYPSSPLNVLRARWYIPVPGDSALEENR
ncbi:MAG TPA: TetR/AcrR family transcriptional regulator, partial [Thermomicrobiales bacterium]|nr:TetR/AcrR family transcriptional regulator [Thermomicrobiales bacterium]